MTERKQEINCRFWSLAVVIACFATGLVWSFSINDVYRGSASIKIGKLGYSGYTQNEQGLVRFSHDRLIESQLALGESLRGRYRIAEAKKNFLPLPYLYHVEERPEGVFNLSARGADPKEVEEFLEEVLDWILSRHKSLFEAGVTDIEELAVGILSLTQDRIKSDSSRDDAQGAKELEKIIEQSLENPASLELLALLEMYKTVRYSLMPEHSAMTEIILPPTSDKRKVKPKLILYFLTTAVVSFFLGLGTYLLLTLVLIARKQGLRKLWG
jgi:hypothetical protein